MKKLPAIGLLILSAAFAADNECNNFELYVYNAAATNRYVSYQVPTYASDDGVTADIDLLVRPHVTLFIKTVINRGSPSGVAPSDLMQPLIKKIARDQVGIDLDIRDENKNYMMHVRVSKDKAASQFDWRCLFMSLDCYLWINPPGQYHLEGLLTPTEMIYRGSCFANVSGKYILKIP